MLPKCFLVDVSVCCVGVTQELINRVRGATEQKMLRDLKRLSRKGRDLEFRGKHGETPVTCSPCLTFLRLLMGRLWGFDGPDMTSCTDQGDVC